MKHKLLIVEDDLNLLEGLKLSLESNDFDVCACENGKKARLEFEKENFSLVVLDIMLPDTSGYELLSLFKKINPMVPIILLTARSDIHDKISGFTIGADDYVTKPFDVRELILRIEARIKISHPATKEVEKLEFENLIIYPSNYEVSVENKKIEMTKLEFDLLYYFALNKGIVLTREMIFERLWGIDAEYSSRAVDMHISRIRKKLRDGKVNDHVSINTVFGVGYRFEH